MSALASWCHRHRLVVLLAWVGLLFALVAGLSVAGTNFGNSTTAQNTDSAKAMALLKQGASSSAGESGTVVWQVRSGTVTDASVQRNIANALDRVAHSPGVVSVGSPYTAAGHQQISKDRTTAYATVAFAEGSSEAQTKTVEKLATSLESGTLHVALNGQAFSVTPASNPASEGLGIVAAFVILLLVFRAVWVAVLPIITAVAGVGTASCP